MVLVFVNCFWLESSIFLKPKIRQLFEICWHGTCTRRFRFVFQRIQFFRRVFLMFCCMSVCHLFAVLQLVTNKLTKQALEGSDQTSFAFLSFEPF